MASLEEQLRHQSLYNDREDVTSTHVAEGASTKYGGGGGGGNVAALVSNLETVQINAANNHSKHLVGQPEYNVKKIGPIVPPKPLKKKCNFPEIPQSSLVKQTCEPLYSQRLQCFDAGALGRGPLLQRKQPVYATHSLYDKTLNNKVTLDNPAILDQQLEALAHHKKQLEKKGLLMQLQHQQQQQQTELSGIPKLSSTSLLKDLSHNERTHAIYTNVRPHSLKLSAANASAQQVYSNVPPPAAYQQQEQRDAAALDGSSDIYSNVLYDQQQTLSNTSPTAFNAENTTYLVQPKTAALAVDADDVEDDDDNDIPPPPSPVSSSYSELRRATNVFATPTTHTLKQQPQPQNAQMHYVATAVSSCVDASGNGGSGVATASAASTAATHKPPTAAAPTGNTPLPREKYMNMQVHYNNNYSSYAPSLQGTSTYESIYEPINPRPPSQLSARSNYLLYSPYSSGGQLPEGVADGSGDAHNGDISTTLSDSLQSSGANTPLHASCGMPLVSKMPTHIHKEAEVEALTNFLVHSMDGTGEVDSYGICHRCNERVLGETSGCTAMDQIYHIACFTCSQCQINLQGKPFYALENKPYCEYDYLQTLEKCSVCMKPILERILRATGKPYHPQCFTCVMCGKSLDGIPFTVDATNQNYCIADFHRKFAPRCCVCKEPIMPEPGEEETVRVVALDRSFHFECYKCEDCDLLLSSEAEGRGCYPLDDHVLCKSCNAKRVQMLTNRMTTEL